MDDITDESFQPEPAHVVEARIDSALEHVFANQIAERRVRPLQSCRTALATLILQASSAGFGRCSVHDGRRP